MHFKNYILLIMLIFFTSTLAAPSNVSIKVMDEASSANEMLLPNPLPIFTDGKFIINEPQPGYILKKLPTINEFKDSPGCYIACYSRQENGSVYAVASDTFVHGQIRVSGTYRGRNCVPINFDKMDISTELGFKNLCNEKFKSCNQSCWAGSDTGGWFGMKK